MSTKENHLAVHTISRSKLNKKVLSNIIPTKFKQISTASVRHKTHVKNLTLTNSEKKQIRDDLSAPDSKVSKISRSRINRSKMIDKFKGFFIVWLNSNKKKPKKNQKKIKLRNGFSPIRNH
jgi:hypothetical protein